MLFARPVRILTTTLLLSILFAPSSLWAQEVATREDRATRESADNERLDDTIEPDSQYLLPVVPKKSAREKKAKPGRIRWPCHGVTPPDWGDFGGKIALTFDDGPSKKNTPKVLKVLKEHKAKATFFVLGTRARRTKSKKIIMQMTARGHLVGGHGWTHPNFNALTEEQARKQFKKMRKLLVSFGLHDPLWFRFPFGQADCKLKRIAAEYGFITVGWHVESLDWCFNSKGICRRISLNKRYRSDQIAYLLRQLRRNNGGIIIFHDTKRNTAANLDAILDKLEGEGYRYVSIDDVATFPKLNGAPIASRKKPRKRAYIGSPCLEQRDCRKSMGRRAICFFHDVTSSGESRGFCTRRCRKRCRGAKKHKAACVEMPNGGGLCLPRPSLRDFVCKRFASSTSQDLPLYKGRSKRKRRRRRRGRKRKRTTVCAPTWLF